MVKTHNVSTVSLPINSYPSPLLLPFLPLPVHFLGSMFLLDHNMYGQMYFFAIISPPLALCDDTVGGNMLHLGLAAFMLNDCDKVSAEIGFYGIEETLWRKVDVKQQFKSSGLHIGAHEEGLFPCYKKDPLISRCTYFFQAVADRGQVSLHSLPWAFLYTDAGLVLFLALSLA